MLTKKLFTLIVPLALILVTCIVCHPPVVLPSPICAGDDVAWRGECTRPQIRNYVTCVEAALPRVEAEVERRQGKRALEALELGALHTAAEAEHRVMREVSALTWQALQHIFRDCRALAQDSPQPTSASDDPIPQVPAQPEPQYAHDLEHAGRCRADLQLGFACAPCTLDSDCIDPDAEHALPKGALCLRESSPRCRALSIGAPMPTPPPSASAPGQCRHDAAINPCGPCRWESDCGAGGADTVHCRSSATRTCRQRAQ